MDVKLCKRVSKFKMSASKAGRWACPKPTKFCLDYFSLTTKRIVLKFGDIVDMDVNLCKRVSKFKILDSNISESIQIPTPNPYIFMFLVIRHIQ